MISNFKQHFRGVTTSIVAPPVLLFAKVSARRAKYKAKVQKLSLFISEPPPNLRVSESARRAKYKAKVQKLSLFISEPPPNLRVSESARRAKYKAKVQKLSLFISEPPPNLRVSESARRAKYELKRRAKVQGERDFFSPLNHELQPLMLCLLPLVQCAEYGQVFGMLILCIFAINMTIKPQNHETSFIAINSSCVLSHSIGAS